MQRSGLFTGAFVLVIIFIVRNEGSHPSERTRHIYDHLMTTDGPHPPRVTDITCLLAPDAGPCRGHIKMFYFTSRDMRCRKFEWGGCQGNGNRFDTEEECMNACVSTASVPKHRPDYCTLTFDYGMCFGNFPRWHYNKEDHACQERIYSGCGGNSNNFDSKDLCESVCLFRTGHIEVPWFKKSV